MKIQTEYPYNNYTGYIVTSKDNRKYLCLVHSTDKSRTTISYARYLISVKEKRVLLPTEDVDHKDEDKTNDSLDNLQILTKSNNVLKSQQNRGITRKMVELICPNCHLQFNKPLNATHLQKGGKYTACSKQCSYSILKKGYSIEQLIELGQSQIIRHFRE